MMRPARRNFLGFSRSLREFLRKHRGATTWKVIQELNRRIRGWVNFYRCLVSSRAFRALDTNLFWSLWRWARWRHPNKRKRWLKSKYFRRIAGRNWVFAAKTPTRERQRVLFPELEGRWLTLLRASSVPIRRHVKVRAETNPFDPRYDTYLHRRHRTPRSVVVGATA